MSVNVDMKKPQSDAKGDLQVNNLVYRQPSALSLAVSRKMCRQYFQRSAYSAGENAIIELNTGSSYINPHNSYLTFKLDLVGAGAEANFGVGSAINLIESITIRSRSGTELDRIDHVNLWAKDNIPHSFSEDWIGHFGSMVGYQGDGENVITSGVIPTRYVIPLNLISGFFNPTGDQLVPPMLASGLHMTFEFARAATALVETSGSVDGYNVTDISIVTDCTDLSDDAQKTLNMESAQSGLEYTYPRVFSTTQAFSTADVNVQIRKAVSQALTATSTIRLVSAKTDAAADSFKAIDWNVDRFQYRLGSLYFPNQEVRDEGQAVESYFIAQQTYDKCKGTRYYCDNSVSLKEFKEGFGIMTVSLERDQELNLSGLPINNSRSLELNATLTTPPTAPHEVVTFLTYAAVAKVFIDNVSTSI